MVFRSLVRSERANALVGWALVGVVALAALESVRRGALAWGGFALLVAAVAATPALVAGEWSVMVPWSLLLVAAAATATRALGAYPETAGTLAVATLALVVVVELDAFTSVDMSRRFAVGFAAMTTMALQGLWTVVQFYSDRWLGTELLSTQTELQWDIVVATGIALAMGGFFVWLFERVDHVGSRRQTPDTPRTS